MSAKFSRAKKAANMTLGGEIKRCARIVAVSLATSSQPYGLTDEAKTSGEKATGGDIRRCYATASDVYAAFPDVKLAKAFYALFKKGDYPNALRLIEASCPLFRNKPIGEFDSNLHQQFRNKRGRISKTQKPLQIVTNPKAMLKYIEDEKDNVGIGKSGWAAGARELGSDLGNSGTRGLPRWVTRHVGKGLGTAIDGTRNGDAPYVLLLTFVEYSQFILSESDKAEAVRIGIDRYLQDKRLTRVVRQALLRELNSQ